MPAAAAALPTEGQAQITVPALFARAVPIAKVAPTEELLALARERAPDPKVFDEREPFFARAQISNNRLDAYFTRMCGDEGCTLSNYAADAAAGVSVQNSHNTRVLGLGRSLTGILSGQQGAKGGGLVRVHSDFFVLPGLSLSGVSSDDVIDGMRAGAIRDVSIGFYGGEIRCSLCGRDLWDWDCWHIPGVAYVKNEKGNWVRADDGADGAQVAVAWIHGAHLAEYSLVYDGATPEAEITGRKAHQEALLLDRRFRIKVPAAERRFAGAQIPTKEARVADEPTAATADTEALAAVRAALVELGITDVADAGGAVRALGRRIADTRASLAEIGAEPTEEPAAALRRLHREVRTLTPLADDGRTYRKDLVDAAIAEGVRAHGNDFAADTYRQVLETLPLETVKRMTADWAAIGKQRFPGGRATKEADERGATQAAQPAIPLRASRA
jgi:hypothetical protein